MRQIVIYATILILSACTNPDKTPGSNPTREASHHELASQMIERNEPFDSIIAEQMLAVKDMRGGKAPEHAYEILSQLGYLQSRTGAYLDALATLQEASDSLMAMDPDSIRGEAPVMLLGNLANLYSRFGLFEEALEKNREAILIAESDKVASDRVPDLMRMRSGTFGDMNMLDSAYLYNFLAIEKSSEIADENFRINAVDKNRTSLALFFIEHPDFAPDSIPYAIKVLETNLFNQYTRRAFTNLSAAGWGHVLTGDAARGIPMMEQGIERCRENGDTESLEYLLGYLAKAYAKTRNPHLFDIYEETMSLHDSLQIQLRDDLLLGKAFQYQTAELKSGLELTQAQLKMTRQRTYYLTAIGLIIIAAGALFMIWRRLQQKALIKEKEDSINSLLADRIALNSRIELLNAEIESRKSQEEEKELLNPILLEKDDEMRFRRIFSEINPGFIEKIRARFPSLTTGNELLCMLIRLKKTNDEIAMALGISRESVATARYRLRTRLSLTKETDLNDFILSL